MTLRSFTVERYRGFKSRTQIKLRPLTLLFGYNSAGKSALLRLLPLVRDSLLKKDREPLDLGSEAIRGASFADLRCRLAASPIIGLELESSSETIRYEILDLARENRQLVERVIRTTSNSAETLEWTTEGDRYELQRPGHPPQQLDLRFRSLALEGEGLRWDVPAGDLLQRVQWLDAVRARIPRREPFGPRGAAVPVAADGRDAPQLFARAYQESSPVIASVREFYRRHLGHEIDLAPLAEDFQIRVSPTSAPTLQVPLIDTGEGLAQVFPVALALARAATPEGPHLLALEQPELHLHPVLHEELATWMVSTLQSSPNARVLVETHSENFLLAVLLAVIEGRLTTDQVLLYWVHQLRVADEVTLDELARPQGPWPPDVFQEDAALATRLNAHRLKRLRP
jgi:hypothetical protein